MAPGARPDTMGRNKKFEDIHLFNLHPEKWFEGYPVKYTQIFFRRAPWKNLGVILNKYDTQISITYKSEKNQVSTLKKSG